MCMCNLPLINSEHKASLALGYIIIILFFVFFIHWTHLLSSFLSGDYILLWGQFFMPVCSLTVTCEGLQACTEQRSHILDMHI